MLMRVLVIDDDPSCRPVWESIPPSEIMIDSYASPAEIKPPEMPRYDFIISEINLARRESFRRLRDVVPEAPLILILPAGKTERPDETVKLAAWDHLYRPLAADVIRGVIRHAIQVRDVYQQAMASPSSDDGKFRFVGTSPVMMTFYRQIARVADSMASVLIEGESGTGKELTARALHRLSRRRGRPFQVVHCGAIPESLMESELFGYAKGAFTGADLPHSGLIEAAQGGTLFLDEITEMSPALQGKLLRFMQNGEVRRLGSHTVSHPTVRVIASTNRDMDQEVVGHRFRADLMFRFVIRLKTPSLRHHKEDLPRLVQTICRRFSMPEPRVDSEAMGLLQGYDWPGNIRELENVLEQTHLLYPYPLMRAAHLPERFRNPQASRPPLYTPLQWAERNQIMQTIQSQGWNRSRTARILGIDRKTLRLKMHFYGLEKERKQTVKSS
ncbi:MAG: sigma-54-dependent Fis family transcriptional regulator [Deltaproteobacteria bacterium]|nr:sigma-54-dependent Fis family transcriptional regulator [Deltaproteobacteria bacterium]